MEDRICLWNGTDKTSSTAYGGPTQVPGNVDILIAGFPCVDFSSMNNHKKGLTDVGESRDGFLAILGYAKRFLPPIIILENVYHAPWEFIAAVWNNDRKKMQEMLLRGNKRKKSDSKGLDDARAARIQAESYWESDKQVYVAVWIKVDTKNYYIPQTRNRGYLCCFLVEPFDSPKAAQAAVLQWAQMFRALGRPTSESVEAFVLPNDDPRLHRMMDEMARRKKPKREVDWEICRGRHERYRDTKGLGTKRPVTQWVDGGSCKAPEYIFHSWLHGQVERIWDFLDTATLRSASRGYDPSFKP